MAPFVVVPDDDFHKVADADGIYRAENGRMRVAFEAEPRQAGSSSKPNRSASLLVKPIAALTVCTPARPYSSS